MDTCTETQLHSSSVRMHEFYSKKHATMHGKNDIDSVSQHLVQVAKEKGSCDNISVIVVFLREPSKVVAEAHWATRHSLIMDTLDNSNATNPFENSNNDNILEKEDYVMNLAEGYKQNGTENIEFLRSANGKCTPHDFDDDDLGPETNVDTIDDVLLSSTVISAKNLMDEIVNNNSLYENEKATLETESEFSKNQQLDHFEDDREDTPTPPADLEIINFQMWFRKLALTETLCCN
ncbi:hypothetical protein FQA39_LY18886 [Lamprigera yunnana]|nr:hypothetical protein FQA39_LY18886 [Lamprigera yunnana]